MTFDLNLIITNTIAGILINLPWFILIWLGFKMLARELQTGIKKIPEWINQYFKLQREQILISKAINSR